MNLFKFLSIIAGTVCLLFLSCTQDEPQIDNRPTVVEITVRNSQGELMSQTVVNMYDETSYQAFENDRTVKPSLTATTDAEGVATFTLEHGQWFASTTSRELMFVVEEFSTNGYRMWSKGGTVSAGKSHTFNIQTDTDLHEEEGTLPEEKQVVLSSIEIVQLPSQTIYPLHSTSINLEGMIIEGIYSDGSRKTLPISEAQVSGFSTDTEMEQCPLTVTIENQTTSFNIKIVNAVIENDVLTQIIENHSGIYYVPDEVKVIGARAFTGYSFEKVILPEGVVEIRPQAFDGSMIQEVVCPNSLELIGKYAFAHCSYLKKVDLSTTKLQLIPENAFQDAAIETILFPESLHTIEDQSFLRTTSLKELTLPLSLETIGLEAFRGSGIVKIVLPHNIRLIRPRAFYLCENLKEVDCHGTSEGSSQGIMETGVFQECKKLSDIVFPESLSIIGPTLFSGQQQLNSITLGMNLQSLQFNALGNASVNVLTIHAEIPPVLDLYSLPKTVKETVYVPRTSLEAYQQAEGWKTLKDKMK